MAVVVKPNTFVTGAVASAAEVNANFDTIFNDYNGNITDANMAASGITTYGKVQGAALSVLSGINSGAGIIPALNLASIYPIGTIYSNVAVATNPGTLLGFGTWVAVTGDAYLGNIWKRTV